MARKTDESCPTCGTKLHALHRDRLQTCSECGRLSPTGFEYCGHCGGPILALPAPVDEADSIDALIDEVLATTAAPPAPTPLASRSRPLEAIIPKLTTGPVQPVRANTGSQSRGPKAAKQPKGFKKPEAPRAAVSGKHPKPPKPLRQARQAGRPVGIPKPVPQSGHTIAVPALQPARPWQTVPATPRSTVRLDHVSRPPAPAPVAETAPSGRPSAGQELEAGKSQRRPAGRSNEGSRKHKTLPPDGPQQQRRRGSNRPFGAGVLSRYGR